MSDDPEALDGLGRALWWLRDPRGAVVHRERAYAGFRRTGDLHRAARIALWLSREYALVWGNRAAANGWLARGERLLASVAPGSDQGWLDLARAERAAEPGAAAAHARSALDVAVRAGDSDLELHALAQLGLAEVSAGRIEEGMTRLDEAMAAITSGEPSSLETFADADLAPLFNGLPDDRCQCLHWGYVVEGRVTFTFADGHEESYEAGDAYFAPPGHTPRLYAGSEIVEFHPTAELAKTIEVVERNLPALAGRESGRRAGTAPSASPSPRVQADVRCCAIL